LLRRRLVVLLLAVFSRDFFGSLPPAWLKTLARSARLRRFLQVRVHARTFSRFRRLPRTGSLTPARNKRAMAFLPAFVAGLSSVVYFRQCYMLSKSC
jgi:hypothetical protein